MKPRSGTSLDPRWGEQKPATGPVGLTQSPRSACQQPEGTCGSASKLTKTLTLVPA